MCHIGLQIHLSQIEMAQLSIYQIQMSQVQMLNFNERQLCGILNHVETYIAIVSKL